MPPLNYDRERWTKRIVVRRTETGARVESADDSGLQVEVSAGALQRWARRGDAELPRSLRAAGFRRYLRRWEVISKGPGDQESEPLKRIALDITDPGLAAYAWEAAIGAAAPRAVTVRTSSVRPDALNLPLTFPLRIVQLNPADCICDVEAAVRRVFGRKLRRDAPLAMQVDTTMFERVAEWRSRNEWPTAEVIHFPLGCADHPDLLSVSSDRPPSLGWLERLTRIWQTRLIVIESGSAVLPTARRLAQLLADRGGPAVIVQDVDADGGHARQDLARIYDDLIHDYPLDRRSPNAASVLVAGMGREESLRVSRIGVQLLDLAAELTDAQTDRPPPAARREMTGAELSLMLQRLTRAGFKAASVPGIVGGAIERQIGKVWPELKFELSERRGTVPLAKAVEAVRTEIGISGPQPIVEVTGPRYLNTRFGQLTELGDFNLLPQRGRALPEIGTAYVVTVRIGPRDQEVETASAAALLEEVLVAPPGATGRWVEISVSGLGFDILGEPTRQLWLPTGAASAAVTFSVVARRLGAASVRIGLYVDQDLVQAVRIGVRIGNATPADLAEHLRLEQADVGDKVWMPRVEYCLGSLDQLSGFGKRVVTVVANDADGADRITVKGEDTFIDATADLKESALAIRNELTAISNGDVNPGQDPVYGFAPFGEDVNSGSPEKLARCLQRLASVGWRLFDLIVPYEYRDTLRQRLAHDDQTIHVAEVLLEKVIPWALIYDREYLEGRRRIRGVEVGHAACLASLPDKHGVVPEFKCGGHESCLLHKSQVARRAEAGEKALDESTVVCPRHFWGFRHLIELPPAQAPRRGEQPPVARKVVNGRPSRVVVGLHGGLARANQHADELERILSEGRVRGRVTTRTSDADELLDVLKYGELDVAYLFCHADGSRDAHGERERVWPPYLKVGPDDASERRITVDKLNGREWENAPLVILNACRSAAFAQDALSTFIRKLTRDRLASGIIGTEITVWEQLATEFGEGFLRDFLSGSLSAGEAVLLARRRLLAKHNPLGLVYTLYARADLALKNPPG